jgi:hypothetical protein
VKDEEGCVKYAQGLRSRVVYDAKEAEPMTSIGGFLETEKRASPPRPADALPVSSG